MSQFFDRNSSISERVGYLLLSKRTSCNTYRSAEAQNAHRSDDTQSLPMHWFPHYPQSHHLFKCFVAAPREPMNVFTLIELSGTWLVPTLQAAERKLCTLSAYRIEDLFLMLSYTSLCIFQHLPFGSLMRASVSTHESCLFINAPTFQIIQPSHAFYSCSYLLWIRSLPQIIRGYGDQDSLVKGPHPS